MLTTFSSPAFGTTRAWVLCGSCIVVYGYVHRDDEGERKAISSPCRMGVVQVLEVVVLLTVVLEGEDRVGVLLHLRLDIAGLGRVARLDEPPVRTIGR